MRGCGKGRGTNLRKEIPSPLNPQAAGSGGVTHPREEHAFRLTIPKTYFSAAHLAGRCPISARNHFQLATRNLSPTSPAPGPPWAASARRAACPTAESTTQTHTRERDAAARNSPARLRQGAQCPRPGGGTDLRSGSERVPPPVSEPELGQMAGSTTRAKQSPCFFFFLSLFSLFPPPRPCLPWLSPWQISPSQTQCAHNTPSTNHFN